MSSFFALQLWELFVLIPLVSAQVPHMSHLKGLLAVIKIIMISVFYICREYLVLSPPSIFSEWRPECLFFSSDKLHDGPAFSKAKYWAARKTDGRIKIKREDKPKNLIKLLKESIGG